MDKILIAGCGDIGTEVGRALVLEGHSVTGLKRHPPTVNESGIHYIKTDLSRLSDLEELDTNFDQVLFIVAPDGQDQDAYKKVFETGLQNLLHIFSENKSEASFTFVSSTNVYAQNRGEWVDEDSMTEPKSIAGITQLSAEKAVIDYHTNSTVIRFSAIYSQERNYLMKISTRRGAKIQKSPPYYTNRIHRDDCIGILLFLIRKKIAGKKLCSIYLGTDDNPASLWDIVSWLAKRVGASPPVKKIFSDKDIVAQNKRCSNKRIKDIGYQFKYKSYPEGYS